MNYLTTREASRKIGIKEDTLRGWIRELKDKEPSTYSVHILTHSHRFNKRLVTYRLSEELVETFKKDNHALRPHTPSTYSGGLDEAVKTERTTTPQETPNQDLYLGIIDTLQEELQAQREDLAKIQEDHKQERADIVRERERQAETIDKIIETHNKEKERTDAIIMSLTRNISQLNERLFLLTEGKLERVEHPQERDQEQPKQDQPAEPEGPKQATPDQPITQAEDYKWTFGDRLWLAKERIREILKKRIF